MGEECSAYKYQHDNGGKTKVETCADPEGVTGGPDPPLKDHKNIGFLSNTGPDSLKITKLPSQHSMLVHNRHDSDTPFQWHFADAPMMARSKCYVDRLSPHQL